MAYIVKRKNREGVYYVYLLESFRDKDKTRVRRLKSYGKYDELEKNEPGAFKRLRLEAQNGQIGKEIPNQLVITLDTNKEINYEYKDYGWKVFESIFSMLNIEKAIGSKLQQKSEVSKYLKILKLLTYQRVLNPGSKLYTQQTQKDLFGKWDLTDNDIYRSLSSLDQLKESIQIEAHKGISNTIGRVGTLVFYDVTNYYFEIDFNDIDEINEENGEIIKEGFRKRGPCKAKSGNPIVQLGLFMDTNGIPISYQLFRGNLTDPKTYIKAIETVKKQFGLERIVVVADKAMNSMSNVSLTGDNKDGWLFSTKHRGMRGASKEIQGFILEETGWRYNEKGNFAIKSKIHTRKLSGAEKEIQEKIVVTWNEKYANREKIRRNGALEYASKLTNAELFRQTAKKGGKKYLEIHYKDKATGELKAFNPFISIDEEKATFDEQFDGINVLVTSEIDMSDEEIIAQYSELYKIEDCFKVTKTEFNSSPVYVRLEAHIEAHFLTCFLALILIRVIQKKINWQLSPGKIIKALQSAKALELTTGFYKVSANEDLKELFNLLNIDFKKDIVRYEDLEKFNNTWCSTK